MNAALFGVLFGGLVFATAAATTMFVALAMEGLDVRRRGSCAQAWRLARPATGIVAAMFAISIGLAWLLVQAFVPSSLGAPYDVGAGDAGGAGGAGDLAGLRGRGAAAHGLRKRGRWRLMGKPEDKAPFALDDRDWVCGTPRLLKEQDDSEAAVRFHRFLADRGHAAAQFYLGLAYDNGEGVEQDDSEAVRWYRLAADQGDARAQNNLGGCYAEGRGVEQDDREAVRWYRLAADQGHAAAQFNLGNMYADGEGVEQDDSEAMRASADERVARRERRRQRFEKWWNEVIRRGEEKRREIQRQFEKAAFGAVVGAGNTSPQAKVYGQRRGAAELRMAAAAAEKKGRQEQFREWFEGGRGARARGRGGAGRRSGGRR